MKKSDRFPWPFSKELGTDLHSLKVSSLLSSFPSSFRLYVQRILFICQPFQRTKHCSALCNIYQRAESSMGLGFGLELGLTVFRSVRHIIHYRELILSSCLVLCLSSCLLLCIISILFFLGQEGCYFKSWFRKYHSSNLTITWLNRELIFLKENSFSLTFFNLEIMPLCISVARNQSSS